MRSKGQDIYYYDAGVACSEHPSPTLSSQQHYLWWARNNIIYDGDIAAVGCIYIPPTRQQIVASLQSSWKFVPRNK